jgi:glycosyltransferase involved in cell wall biosynthesis
MARVDMHCHSRHSDRPAHWVFQKIGARESYISPETLYQCLKSRGMDFVTITDHDSIEGALEIAGRHGDAFVSCEFTVRFPGTTQIETHICAYDITEEQFRQGRALSHDLGEFARYFREQGVLTSVPHPLYDNRGQLDVCHLEQLVLLFENFEELTGMQMAAANAMQKEFLDKLSPAILSELARKHGIQPAFPEPWRKGRLAGTDDHSSFFLGRCFTEVEGAETYREFLRGIREKRSTAHGLCLTALEFAHSTQSNVVNTVIDHYCEPGPFDQCLSQLISHISPQLKGSGDLGASSQLVSMIPLYFVQMLIKDWRNTDLVFHRVPDRDLPEETFNLVSTVFNALFHHAFSQWSEQLKKGQILDAVAKLSLIAPTFVAAIPYLMGYRHFYSANDYRRRIAGAYHLRNPLEERPEKWAWFTDTLLDVNGVARTIQALNTLPADSRPPVTIITCHPKEQRPDGNVANFQPLYHFALPEYESMVLAIPPLLNMLHYCEKEQFTRFVLSTPGPVGLVALWIAQILALPTSAVYHTDLPSYARRLTGDKAIEEWAWRLVRFFYGKADHVYVLSETSRERLRRKGLQHDDIRIFPKGTDVEQFHPGRRDPGVWKRWSMDGRTKILYVGRISKEKDLDILAESFRRIRAARDDVELVIVGDGPYLETLRKQMDGMPGVLFTGFLEGDELAELFASADIFAFPSTTDTYGSVVLEAQSSGLPVVVSDKGGPREAMVDGKTGLVTRGGDAASFSAALARLVEDEALRRLMGRNARIHVEGKTWQAAFEAFRTDHLRAR